MDELKLDLGCGINKREGFIGVDCRKFDNVDIVADLNMPWQWEDNSVDEVHASHFVEHLTPAQRIHFVNELCRVLKPGAKATIITPYWGSNRAYGDLTHKWPPVCEMWYMYLNKEWRSKNAPHNDEYTCDFDATWGGSFHPQVAIRNQEFQEFASMFYKEAIQDLYATLIKR